MEFYGKKSVSKKKQRLPPPRGQIKKNMFKITVQVVVELMGMKREKEKVSSLNSTSPHENACELNYDDDFDR